MPRPRRLGPPKCPITRAGLSPGEALRKEVDQGELSETGGGLIAGLELGLKECEARRRLREVEVLELRSGGFVKHGAVLDVPGFLLDALGVPADLGAGLRQAVEHTLESFTSKRDAKRVVAAQGAGKVQKPRRGSMARRHKRMELPCRTMEPVTILGLT